MSKESFKEFCESQILFFSNFLKQIKHYRDNYKKDDFSIEDQDIINKTFELNLLFAISLLDNLVIIKNLDNAKLDWEVKFFLKKLNLNIYETFIAYDSSKNWILNTLCKTEEEKEKFKLTNTELKEFKKTYNYDTEIKQIRHKIAGHITSEDIDLYFKTIELLNPRKNIATGIAYIAAANKINAFIFELFGKRIKK